MCRFYSFGLFVSSFTFPDSLFQICIVIQDGSDGLFRIVLLGIRCLAKYINTFAAKRDCSRIYRSLPNATAVEI